MNKTIIIVGIVILGLISGGLYIANQQSQKSEEAKLMEQKDAAIEKTNDETMAKNNNNIGDGSSMQKSDDRYVEYSKAVLDGAVNNRRVLFFYASWCPTCRPTDVDLKANLSKIPADLTVLRVNYNDPETDQEEKDLAKKYGITYQHTFVQIDGQGKEVAKWNGGKTDDLLANIK